MLFITLFLLSDLVNLLQKHIFLHLIIYQIAENLPRKVNSYAKDSYFKKKKFTRHFFSLLNVGFTTSKNEHKEAVMVISNWTMRTKDGRPLYAFRWWKNL